MRAMTRAEPIAREYRLQFANKNFVRLETRIQIDAMGRKRTFPMTA